MVDRYQSFLDRSRNSLDLSTPINQQNSVNYQRYIESSHLYLSMMKKYTKQYEKATTSEEQKQILEVYRQQQSRFRKDRENLAKEFHQLEKKTEGIESLFVKEQLLKIVRTQMNVDLEMKELVKKRKQQKQLQAQKFHQGSTRLQNAVKDLEEKRDQILYLEQSVNECVQLLQLIGILTLENGKKIDETLQHVQKAKENIKKGEEKIRVAKKGTEGWGLCYIMVLSVLALLM